MTGQQWEPRPPVDISDIPMVEISDGEELMPELLPSWAIALLTISFAFFIIAAGVAILWSAVVA